MDKLTYQREFNRFQQNREKYWAPKIKKALKAQVRQFTNGYDGNTHNQLIRITSTSIFILVMDINKDAMKTFGVQMYLRLPKKGQKGLIQNLHQQFINLVNSHFVGEILQTAERITNTTREVIKRILTENPGMGFEKQARLIEKETDDLNFNRSLVIARTETVTATNKASYYAAGKTGLKYQKEWLSAGDSRVRPDHAEVNGTRIDMNDYFLVGEDEMLVPGARVQENGLPTDPKEVINCRCTALYLPVRDRRGRPIEHDYGLWPMG